MTEFGNVERLRILADRLGNAPFYLIKTELGILLNAFQSNENTRFLLEGLVYREQENLGAYAGLFIEGKNFEHVASLPFVKTAEQRAAFGYQILKGLVSGGDDWEKVAKNILAVGARYAEGKTRGIDIIGRWVDVFIYPVIDYLEGAHNPDEIVLAIMIKYKQRCEWFERERLLDISRCGEKECSNTYGGQAERRLKTDFYRYLFDKGVEFTVEPRSPKGSGEPDVMTARFPDGRLLIVEAKVYDGASRNDHWVRSGIAQASSYAEEWGELRAYLLVYNVAEDSTLDFLEATKKDYFWDISSCSRGVRIIVVNLNKAKPASQESKLSRHTI